MKKWRQVALSLVVVTSFGCASKGEEKPTDLLGSPDGSMVPIHEGGTGTDASGFGGSQTGSSMDGGSSQFGGMAGVPSQRVVYFDYDRSELRSDSREVVAGHGSFLSANSNVNIRLEGHADERGSREYNLALGERRAESVKRGLATLGVREGQVTTLSYGEERPAASGSNDNAWQLNRRVEFVYP